MELDEGIGVLTVLLGAVLYSNVLYCTVMDAGWIAIAWYAYDTVTFTVGRTRNEHDV